MKKHSIKIMLASLLLAFTATSCDDYLDVNNNEDSPAYVEGYLYLAGIQQAYSDIYYDLRAAAPLTQMMGTTSYTSFATHYYSKSSDAGGQIWRTVYWNQGMNLENMIKQSEANGEWTLAGIGYAMKAFSWDMLTKYHGELPMKEAFVAGLLSHHYDYQDEIYEQVRVWAQKAIECLEKEDNNNYGTKITANDYIYGGDKAKWKRFAYSVIVRNLASLTKKSDFKEKYYAQLVDAASKAFASNSDNAAVTIGGGGADAAQSAYNNFWGVYRGNMSWSYFQHQYAVEVFTGTVPVYDSNGNKIAVTGNKYCPYELSDKQIICDTLEVAGHYDPRVVVKLGTEDGNSVATETDIKAIRKYKYYGGSFTSQTGTIGRAPSYYGRTETPTDAKDGAGRWLYHNNAPYVLTTYAEILFDLAEAHYVVGNKTEAFSAWKKAVAADMDFTAGYLVPGTVATIGSTTYHQGDKISSALFKSAAAEYLAGPYVENLSIDDFSISHIMMQKWVALYPWGAMEAWVDERKNMYDMEYTGEYPNYGNGFDINTVTMKTDNDPTKVYKGFYLSPAQVDGRKISYNSDNNGSPCFRIRPRYNSEYMWNKNSLDALKPISGLAINYQTSIPWFAYPKEMPK